MHIFGNKGCVPIKVDIFRNKIWAEIKVDIFRNNRLPTSRDWDLCLISEINSGWLENCNFWK